MDENGKSFYSYIQYILYISFYFALITPKLRAEGGKNGGTNGSDDFHRHFSFNNSLIIYIYVANV